MKQIKTICDRCGKEIDDDTEFRILPRYDVLKVFDDDLFSTTRQIALDLCPDCRGQLEVWISDSSTGVTRNNG